MFGQCSICHGGPVAHVHASSLRVVCDKDACRVAALLPTPPRLAPFQHRSKDGSAVKGLHADATLFYAAEGACDKMDVMDPLSVRTTATGPGLTLLPVLGPSLRPTTAAESHYHEKKGIYVFEYQTKHRFPARDPISPYAALDVGADVRTRTRKEKEHLLRHVWTYQLSQAYIAMVRSHQAMGALSDLPDETPIHVAYDEPPSGPPEQDVHVFVPNRRDTWHPYVVMRQCAERMVAATTTAAEKHALRTAMSIAAVDACYTGRRHPAEQLFAYVYDTRAVHEFVAPPERGAEPDPDVMEHPQMRAVDFLATHPRLLAVVHVAAEVTRAQIHRAFRTRSAPPPPAARPAEEEMGDVRLPEGETPSKWTTLQPDDRATGVLGMAVLAEDNFMVWQALGRFIGAVRHQYRPPAAPLADLCLPKAYHTAQALRNMWPDAAVQNDAVAIRFAPLDIGRGDMVFVHAIPDASTHRDVVCAGIASGPVRSKAKRQEPEEEGGETEEHRGKRRRADDEAGEDPVARQRRLVHAFVRHVENIEMNDAAAILSRADLNVDALYRELLSSVKTDDPAMPQEYRLGEGGEYPIPPRLYEDVVQLLVEHHGGRVSDLSMGDNALLRHARFFRRQDLVAQLLDDANVRAADERAPPMVRPVVLDLISESADSEVEIVPNSDDDEGM